MSELQFQFPKPGEWNEFSMTAVWSDSEGYTHSERFTQEDIPTGLQGALTSVVSALVGLAEPWQAVQVWARLVEYYIPEEDDSVRTQEAVMLTVEAVNSSGGRKILTSNDYESFILYNQEVIEFYKYFTIG